MRWFHPWVGLGYVGSDCSNIFTTLRCASTVTPRRPRSLRVICLRGVRLKINGTAQLCSIL